MGLNCACAYRIVPIGRHNKLIKITSQVVKLEQQCTVKGTHSVLENANLKNSKGAWGATLNQLVSVNT